MFSIFSSTCHRIMLTWASCHGLVRQTFKTQLRRKQFLSNLSPQSLAHYSFTSCFFKLPLFVLNGHLFYKGTRYLRFAELQFNVDVYQCSQIMRSFSSLQNICLRSYIQLDMNISVFLAYVRLHQKYFQRCNKIIEKISLQSEYIFIKFLASN